MRAGLQSREEYDRTEGTERDDTQQRQKCEVSHRRRLWHRLCVEPAHNCKSAFNLEVQGRFLRGVEIMLDQTYSLVLWS